VVLGLVFGGLALLAAALWAFAGHTSVPLLHDNVASRLGEADSGP
jgi:hypothetical protein